MLTGKHNLYQHVKYGKYDLFVPINGEEKKIKKWKWQYQPNNVKQQCTWGTHFGETKLVASTTGNPEDTNLRISSTFTPVGTVFFSFCNPSLGPTSTIFTDLGIPFKNYITQNIYLHISVFSSERALLDEHFHNPPKTPKKKK